jgi:type I restriction enzyme S subunit
MSFLSCKLKDAVELAYGKALPERIRKDGEIPVYGSGGIGGYHNESIVTGPGVIVGRKGTIGSVFYEKSDFYPIDTVYYVKTNPQKIGIRFAYYLLKNLNLSSLNSDAAVPGLNRDRAYDLTIKLPDVKTQSNILQILEKYDDLIENNRRRIQLLEDAARLLYREWFIYLRFPGHEHVKIVDGVPEGWKSTTMDNVCEYINRGISPTYDDDGEYLVINQKCIRNKLLNLDLARKQSKVYKEEKAVQLGDILINSTGTGTLGRVAQAWVNYEKTTIDSHVTIVRPNQDIPYLWLGYTLMSLEKVLEDMGEGATNQKELNRARIREIAVILPPKQMMEEFHSFVSPLVSQIQMLMQQNKKLTEARDLLLPRLMSGEISV